MVNSKLVNASIKVLKQKNSRKNCRRKAPAKQQTRNSKRKVPAGSRFTTGETQVAFETLQKQTYVRMNH